MTTQHTPGPWISYPSPKGHAIDIYDGRDGVPFEPLATVSLVEKRKHGIRFTEERQGNAGLIAAAPELLAALQELLTDKYLRDPINKDRMAKARAAIAKATGEEVNP